MAGADFTVHASLQARTHSQDKVPNRAMSVPVKVAMIEIDLDENDNQILDKYHVMVHEDDTAGTGIIIMSLGTLCTEAVTNANTASVITVRRRGTSTASLAVITTTDNAAVGEWHAVDADIIINWDNRANTEDRTLYHVPLGDGIEVALTTAGSETTSAGDGAGKLLVMCEYVVVPRTITENL